MSHVKGSGSVRQQHQRPGKRLGVKKFGGEKIKVGQIIVRQKGAKYKNGKNVGMGSDYTLFAMKDGHVVYGKKWGRTLVSVQ